MAAEILQLAIFEAQKYKPINPRHFQLAIGKDEELSNCIEGYGTKQPGVLVPNPDRQELDDWNPEKKTI